ncbi:hypothetical protein [Nonomuraea salmonea]|uniref:hypothetical protein n=1 Tax=Nonomuraea salmonea TaxID=46181 RepID=UPI002FED1C4E
MPEERTRSFGLAGFDLVVRLLDCCSAEEDRSPVELSWSAEEWRSVEDGPSAWAGEVVVGFAEAAVPGWFGEFRWVGVLPAEVVGFGWVADAGGFSAVRAEVGSGERVVFAAGEGGVRAAAGLGESSLPLVAHAVVEAAAATATLAARAAQRRRLGESLRVCGDGFRGCGDGLRECWPKVNHGPG